MTCMRDFKAQIAIWARTAPPKNGQINTEINSQNKKRGNLILFASLEPRVLLEGGQFLSSHQLLDERG